MRYSLPSYREWEFRIPYSPLQEEPNRVLASLVSLAVFSSSLAPAKLLSFGRTCCASPLSSLCSHCVP